MLTMNTLLERALEIVAKTHSGLTEDDEEPYWCDFDDCLAIVTIDNTNYVIRYNNFTNLYETDIA